MSAKLQVGRGGGGDAMRKDILWYNKFGRGASVLTSKGRGGLLLLNGVCTGYIKRWVRKIVTVCNRASGRMVLFVDEMKMGDTTIENRTCPYLTWNEVMKLREKYPFCNVEPAGRMLRSRVLKPHEITSANLSHITHHISFLSSYDTTVKLCPYVEQTSFVYQNGEKVWAESHTLQLYQGEVTSYLWSADLIRIGIHFAARLGKTGWVMREATRKSHNGCTVMLQANNRDRWRQIHAQSTEFVQGFGYDRIWPPWFTRTMLEVVPRKNPVPTLQCSVLKHMMQAAKLNNHFWLLAPSTRNYQSVRQLYLEPVFVPVWQKL